jgi:hypothetical protein
MRVEVCRSRRSGRRFDLEASRADAVPTIPRAVLHSPFRNRGIRAGHIFCPSCRLPSLVVLVYSKAAMCFTWIPGLSMSMLGVCPSNAILLRQTIRKHLRRSRLKTFLNVFQRIRLRMFRACGLASASSSFASRRRITRTDS